ncbi:hypothetical protein Bca52824_048175 [Brassica carinata]|uniref:Sugar phosphate transporter domain-containing protein n=1 Tax=Brassica carinata TaxID=52824 RepID=A0A8X7USX9_BRACI|nr:hypothetical protein Bca52824_048175 [Brassica carinata]
MFYHLYNQFPSLPLNIREPHTVAPLTHAVRNILKRVFVIGFAIVIFGNKILTQTDIGTAIAITGVALYSIIKAKIEEDKKELIGDAEGHEPVVHEGSSRDAATRAVVESSGSPNIPLEKRKKSSCGSDASAYAAKTPSVAPPTTTGGGSASEEPRIKFRDRVEFKYDGDTPLACAPSECAELIRQIRGGAKDMPPVKDLLFKDAYVDAARTKVLSDGSMNYVVELYDTALKETISKLKQSDRLVRARDTVLNRKTSEFRATIDKAAVEQSRLLAGKKAQKEKFMEKFGELKDKFKNAGEKIRGLERERAALEKEKTALEEKRVATALRHLKEVNRLRDSRSYEDVLAANDPYGSNASLIDAGTAASLQTPTGSQGDHATERPNEPTGRELWESYVQGHEVVSRVERSEDATAPLVLGPAPSMANLVVSEELLIPVLRVSDANPTLPLGLEEAGSEPVDLLELSDFQLKKRVVKNRTSGSPGIIRKEQRKEWSTKLRIRLLRQRTRLEAPQISSKLESSRKTLIMPKTNLICCC